VKTLPTSTTLAAALDCVDTFYEIVFRTWPTAVTRTEGPYRLCYSGDTRLTGANHLWPLTPDAITPDALNAALAFFADHDAAWSVVFTDSFTPDARDLLVARGFYRRWASPLMLLDGPPQRVPVHPHARPIRATTLEHLHDVARVMSAAFATDYATNRRIARAEMLEHPAITHYLIYERDQAACCATVARCGSMAGVWNVGTSPRFQRQGYASTIMLALLDDLRATGCTTTTLMASPSGKPLYDRLGYRQIGLTAYMGPPRYLRARPLY